MLRKKFIILIAVIVIFSTFLSFIRVPDVYADGTIKVATDILNVRQDPDSDSPIITNVQRGETYPVVDSKGEWLKIQVSSSEAGWVASFLVTESNTASTERSDSGSSSQAVQVLTDDLRVRSGPGTNFTVVGLVHSTDKVTLEDQNENWAKISGSGIDGWVSKEFLAITSTTLQESTAQENQTEEQQSATITTDGLNVRSEPNTQSSILDSLSEGKNVSVIAQRQEWLKISYDDTTGWIHHDYAKIHTNNSGGEGESSPDSSATITVSGLNVRDEPSLNGKVLDQISADTTVTILNEHNNWCEIEYADGKTGWVAGWFLEKKRISVNQSSYDGEGTVVIVENGTNIRESASTNGKVILRANEGDTFSIIGIENDWYKIKLSDGTEAFVAGWIVAISGGATSITKAGAEQYLKNKVIVLDPGHGGRDVGAIGVQGTYEKDLTLRTARVLQDKLKAAGATVILTRQNDSSVSLHARPQVANFHHADAFLSIHYDSIEDTSVTGTTTFYHQAGDKALAEQVHNSLIQFTNLRDRQIRQEDYLVLRESRQPSLLMELGYISNRGEELTILSSDFQERAATAIYQGLAQYFKGN